MIALHGLMVPKWSSSSSRCALDVAALPDTIAKYGALPESRLY